jgi:predicted enzyme related to lactoylglutathione lyase
VKESPEYTEWLSGDKHIGGLMRIGDDWGPVPPNWLSYVAVTACDATAERARSLGAKVIVGPAEIPDAGRFAVLTDPQGAVFAVYTAAAHR